MDWFSVAVGFVVGAFTGAAGTYLADKYTDVRRANEARSNADRQWQDTCERFPKIVSEMKADVRNPEYADIRKFFVKSSKTTVNKAEPGFEYHTDVHRDLSAAIEYLEELGYIENITPGNFPMYRMREKFVDLLRHG
jgi:hypothetical protein